MWQFAKEDNFLLRWVPWVPNGTIQRRHSIHFIFILFFLAWGYIYLHLATDNIILKENESHCPSSWHHRQLSERERQLNSIFHPGNVTHQTSLVDFLKVYSFMFGGGACICHVSLEHPALKVTAHSSLSLTPNGDSLSGRAPSLPIWMVSLDPEAWPYLETIPKSGCLNYLQYDLWHGSLQLLSCLTCDN